MLDHVKHKLQGIGTHTHTHTHTHTPVTASFPSNQRTVLLYFQLQTGCGVVSTSHPSQISVLRAAVCGSAIVPESLHVQWSMCLCYSHYIYMTDWVPFNAWTWRWRVKWWHWRVARSIHLQNTMFSSNFSVKWTQLVGKAQESRGDSFLCMWHASGLRVGRRPLPSPQCVDALVAVIVHAEPACRSLRRTE